MKLELMAPSGNKESFLSALENGADSVYLGLQKFNARRPAGNFDFSSLKKALLYAHSNDKKIYLALNIDLKSNELNDAIGFVEFAHQAGIDGIIIKDPALLQIIKKFYDINIHFSTQNAIESVAGAEFVASQGVKRIVLAREMELKEIAQCSKIDGLEIEVFTEGSMCFSVSGRCLLSSWVGGRSGNRGCCTAPCRVMWQSGKKSGNFFSMKDLNLVDHLKKLEDAGVKALKIEGRLKNANWVGAVTKIYRKAIDLIAHNDETGGHTDTKPLSSELKKYSARERAAGHLEGHKDLTGANREWEDFETDSEQEKPADMNLFDETNVITISRLDEIITVKIYAGGMERSFEKKIQPEPKKGRRASINEVAGSMAVSGKKFSVEINCPEFHSSASFINSLLVDMEKAAAVVLKKDTAKTGLKPEIVEVIAQRDMGIKRNRVLGDRPDKAIILPEHTDIFLKNGYGIKTVVITPGTEADFDKITELNKKYKTIISIPPVLFGDNASRFSIMIEKLYKAGFRDFEVNSYTGIGMLKGFDVEKHLGVDMPVYNHVSAGYFKNLGFKSVYCPVEGDPSIFKSVTSFSDIKVECMVYGRLPLFISRVDSPDFKNGSVFKDKYCELVCRKYNGLNYFIEKIPLCFVGNKFKKENINFDSLTIDLRFFENLEYILKNINENKVKGSEFNFFRKLV